VQRDVPYSKLSALQCSRPTLWQVGPDEGQTQPAAIDQSPLVWAGLVLAHTFKTLCKLASKNQCL